MLHNDLFCSQHIPGAVRFNTDDIADKSAPLPRTPPSPEQFGEQVGKVSVYCIGVLLIVFLYSLVYLTMIMLLYMITTVL